MLTVGYVRVSTEEQAADGFSIEGQADKLRSYAALHDLGPLTLVADPGCSGKDMERPGLQRLLTMIEQGHVVHVLGWRLDRLSRDLDDLIMLADRCQQAGVNLHSFMEKLDLSSATGRMFFNILGSFAQFYREQLGENVRLGWSARCGRAGGPTGQNAATTCVMASSCPTGTRGRCDASSPCVRRDAATGRSRKRRESSSRR
jgi:site-specific DNA recombinase